MVWTDYAREPYYSTAVGLLHYVKESHLNGEAEVENVLRHQLARGSLTNSWLRKEFNFCEAARYCLPCTWCAYDGEIMFEPMELTNDAVIKVIGVGGGGGNAVEFTWCASASKVLEFFAVNTDAQALVQWRLARLFKLVAALPVSGRRR